MGLGAMMQTWLNVLTHPGEATFQEECNTPYASLTTAIIWVAVATVVTAIFAVVGFVTSDNQPMGRITASNIIPMGIRQQFAQSISNGSFFIVLRIAFVFITPIIFLIVSGVFFLIAKKFGGNGKFEEQTYLLSIFWVPITMVNAVMKAIPFLGGYIVLTIFIFSIYEIVLATLAVKVSHNLTIGKAISSVLPPILMIFLCSICTVVVGIGSQLKDG